MKVFVSLRETKKTMVNGEAFDHYTSLLGPSISWTRSGVSCGI